MDGPGRECPGGLDRARIIADKRHSTSTGESFRNGVRVGTGQNVAKISGLWACSYAPKGLRGFSPGFQPRNRPIKGSALKGRKLTWINPTRIAPQNEFRRHAPPIGVRRTERRHSIFGGENDVHQNKGERSGHMQLHHIYMLLSCSILRPFGARRRGGTVPGVETPG